MTAVDAVLNTTLSSVFSLALQNYTCGVCVCVCVCMCALVLLFMRGLNRPTTPNVRGLFWRPRTLLRPPTFWLQIRNLGRKFDVLAKFRCVLGSIVLSRNCHTARILECFKPLGCVVTLHPAISESVSNITLICAF